MNYNGALTNHDWQEEPAYVLPLGKWWRCRHCNIIATDNPGPPLYPVWNFSPCSGYFYGHQLPKNQAESVKQRDSRAGMD